MTIEPALRVRQFKPTVFAEMSELSARYGSVNLGQGFPDFAAPDFVKEAAKAAIDAEANQYAHPYGIPSLREAIADDWTSRYGIELDPARHITVTSGATEAIFDAVLALVDPADAVITFEPFYDSYPASAALAGAELRAVRLHPPEWTFDLDELRAAASGNARMLLLNTPHNPTGKVFTRDELAAIAEVAASHDLIVVTDEVYDRIIFDDAEHVPIATLPGMWERTLTINSTGKTFSLTGWKIGYAIGPESLNDAIRSVHQFVTFATSTPFQHAMATAIREAPSNGYYREMTEAYRERRDVLTGVVEAAGMTVLPVQGSYFLQASFDGFDASNDVEFCRWMIAEVGVTPIPPSAFYVEPDTAPHLVRFCFAKELATLEEAGRRMAGMASIATGTVHEVVTE